MARACDRRGTTAAGRISDAIPIFDQPSPRCTEGCLETCSRVIFWKTCAGMRLEGQMTTNWCRVLMLAAAFGVLMLPPARAANPSRMTGIFSDLYYNEEGGDLLGTEIFVVVTGQGSNYAVFFQNWEGGSTFPVVVPAQVDGDKITFKVPPPSDAAGTYSGRISKSGFDGTWKHKYDDGSYHTDPIQLRRKNSYWQ